MKVIFLDIDGVLNSEDACERKAWAYDAKGNVQTMLLGIDSFNIPPLREIIERSGAKVVLSSTWRLSHDGRSRTADNIRRAGLEIEFIGSTPSLWTERGLEIQSWLNWHAENRPADPVTHFVIIDDSADMAHLMPYLVRTSWEHGLLPEHVAPALALLGAAR